MALLWWKRPTDQSDIPGGTVDRKRVHSHDDQLNSVANLEVHRVRVDFHDLKEDRENRKHN